MAFICFRPSSSTTALSKPIQIPEIPPFRKKSAEDHSSSGSPQRGSTSSSSPKLPEIPPYKTRKSAELTPQMSGESTHSQTHGPEWMKRLKVNESSTIHRSIDCIASKELASNSEPDILKPAPSWTNITTKAEPSSSGTTSPPTAAPQKTSNVSDEEAKAAELAAKKSRLKQSLVKRARSVAIFSLKLKERRQREAEKAALAAVEHAKAIALVPPPGGELSVIPIEKLIQVDDVIMQKPSHQSPGSGTL